MDEGNSWIPDPLKLRRSKDFRLQMLSGSLLRFLHLSQDTSYRFIFTWLISGQLSAIRQPSIWNSIKAFDAILVGRFFSFSQYARLKTSSLWRYWMDEWTSTKLSQPVSLMVLILIAFDRSGISVKYLDLERSISIKLTRFCHEHATKKKRN